MSQLPPGITVGKHCNEQHEPVTLFLFHPFTGKLADDLAEELAAMPFFRRREAKAAISYAKAHGGRFYWRRNDESGEWDRVELLNFSFVAMACGQQVTLEHNFPAGTDRLEFVRKLAVEVK